MNRRKIYDMIFGSPPKIIASYLVTFGLMLLGYKGCNDYHNNGIIETPETTVTSKSYGVFGHDEYFIHADGSQEVRAFSAWGAGASRFKVLNDVDGDTLVDRISINGDGSCALKLRELLNRKTDYPTHKNQFDKADKKLREAAEYAAKMRE